MIVESPPLCGTDSVGIAEEHRPLRLPPDQQGGWEVLHDGTRHGPPLRTRALGGPVTRGLGSGPAGRMNQSFPIQGWVWCDERTKSDSVGVLSGSAGGTANGTHSVSRTTSAARDTFSLATLLVDRKLRWPVRRNLRPLSNPQR